jgi:hypothetical protein
MSVLVWIILSFVLGALLTFATIIAAFCGISADLSSSDSERKPPGGKRASPSVTNAKAHASA